MAPYTKRQNFNVDADEAAELEAARLNLRASTTKDAVLRAARLINALARELDDGKRLVSVDQNGHETRIVLPDIEPSGTQWKFLCSRAHPWRKQLYVKGRKLLASDVWGDMIANSMSPDEAAKDRDLPIEAVQEAIQYCEQNLDLIRMEAEEEKQRLITAGIKLSA